MKKFTLATIVLTLALPAVGVFAQQKMDDMKGTVTVAHGPVQSMKWPAMTMAFKVKDKMLFDQFADGKEVEFEFAKIGKDYVVTSVK